MTTTPNPIEIRICPRCAGRGVIPKGGFHFKKSVKCPYCHGLGDMEFHTETQHWTPKPVYEYEPNPFGHIRFSLA